jgi:NAD(P)-dependent dehydrogenase (short-subunit alcohol dehydrogenase family)
MKLFHENEWALILGGSSGFGLASAKKLSSMGMSICVVHRDRKGAMERINEQFDDIRKNGQPFIALNEDALSLEGQTKILDALSEGMKEKGKVKTVLHSIAFGNLKPIAPIEKSSANKTSQEKILDSLATRLRINSDQLKQEISSLFSDNHSELNS